ncbi:DNA-binding transcriptional regulator, LysR family [Nocardioides exalbidus]|uniref:DNA-binding transcriptional regulator, LysR family n=1 Tax=Nocardioides exalbidus TaxID=402596 RepID=A0A1H4WZT6_9ACTN|nr:LysR family transcriptional regulator [Nocardioides exalbidus]SEC98847.1 DNA-binding transcriptional regulator, LysR family [Nocardioides exalbidus]
MPAGQGWFLRRTLGDVETRELRYFVAVAEESHVGRAAERLGMAQPPLSRAIAQLERRLGAELFVRTPRGMELTTAGETLLREGRVALAAVEAAERRTRRSVEVSGPRVVLTAKAGASSELMAKLLDAYAAEPDAVDVEVVLSAPGYQAPMLRDGRADVAILHRPFDDLSGFDADVLAVEDQVLILPSGHPLTARESMTVAEATSIPDLPVPRWPHLDGSYPDGPGPELRDLTQVLQLVRLGRTAIVLPESARANLRDGLAVVRLTDAPQVTTVIAWQPHSTSTGVAGLVRTASRL